MDAVYALIDEFDRNRHESMVFDEFRKIENNLDQHGARRSYRSTPVISGTLNLTRVLGGNFAENPLQVTVDELNQGFFNAPVRDSTLQREIYVRINFRNKSDK